MPTKKPKVQIILEEDIYKLLNELAEKEMRSISQMGGYIITGYLKEYEAKTTKEQERTEIKSKLSDSKIG